MATFAKIGANNLVIDICSVNDKDTSDENGVEVESIGVAYLTELTGHANWKKTSVNTYKGEHSEGGTPLRINYANIGGTYDEGRDAFIPVHTYPSWILNETTCSYEPPTAHPEDDKVYQWNENTKTWDELTANPPSSLDPEGPPLTEPKTTGKPY